MTTSHVFAPNPVPSLAVLGDVRTYPVRRIFCVGRNYSDHVREMGGDPKQDPPIFFTKPADALVMDGATIAYPKATHDLHHEVELVVALGSELDMADETAAAQAIYGLAVGVDLTRRDLQAQAKQKGAPWDIGKAFDQSAPVSAILPIAQLPDPMKGAIRLSVNGAMRQQDDLANMIWSVPELLARLSHLFHLRPGDLVFTGTPHGVGPLQPGDKVHCEIECVGELDFHIAP